MKRRLMKTAWALRGHFSTFSEALRRAWKLIKLSAKLKQGVVSFSYIKKDGSLRKANGTLINTPVAGKSNSDSSYKVFTYFDVDANDWRCACIQNVIV